MPIARFWAYWALCDDPDCTGDATADAGIYPDREQVIEEARKAGWLFVGARKTYCPECRIRHEPAREAK